MSRLLRGKNPFLVEQECGSTPEIEEKKQKMRLEGVEPTADKV